MLAKAEAETVARRANEKGLNERTPRLGPRPQKH